MAKFINNKEVKNVVNYIARAIGAEMMNRYSLAGEYWEVVDYISRNMAFSHVVEADDAVWLYRGGLIEAIAHYDCGHKEIWGEHYIPDSAQSKWVELVNGDIVLHFTMAGECSFCQEKASTEADRAKMTRELDDIVWYHGLQFSNKCGWGQELLDRIDAVSSHPEWEICASDAHLGSCGLRVSGRVELAYDRDVWSYLGDEEERVSHGAGNLVSDMASYEAIQSEERCFYMEVFLSSVSIHAIWMDAEEARIHPETRDMLEAHAASMGVPFELL